MSSFVGKKTKRPFCISVRVERGKGVGLKKGKEVELKYKSPLVNSVLWYDRVYWGGHPNHAVLQSIFVVYIWVCDTPAFHSSR